MGVKVPLNNCFPMRRQLSLKPACHNIQNVLKFTTILYGELNQRFSADAGWLHARLVRIGIERHGV